MFTKTDYGGVLLDDRSGSYWQLNSTSATIFAGICEGRSAESIAQQLVDIFDGVDLDEATADTAELITQLRATGIAE